MFLCISGSELNEKPDAMTPTLFKITMLKLEIEVENHTPYVCQRTFMLCIGEVCMANESMEITVRVSRRVEAQ